MLFNLFPFAAFLFSQYFIYYCAFACSVLPHTFYFQLHFGRLQCELRNELWVRYGLNKRTMNWLFIIVNKNNEMRKKFCLETDGLNVTISSDYLPVLIAQLNHHSPNLSQHTK